MSLTEDVLRSHIILFFLNFSCQEVSPWVDAIIQPYQFDPESDPEGEAPEEVQILQQDVSEWLVCLNMLLSLFVCVVTVTTI